MRNDRVRGYSSMARVFAIAVVAVIPALGTGFWAGSPDCRQRPLFANSWWPGDGDTDDIVAGFDGTLSGDATFGDGQVDQAFVFDGNGDAVSDIGNLDTYAFIQNTGVFTIEAWIKLDDPNADAAGLITANTGSPLGRGHFFAWENRSSFSADRQLRFFAARGIATPCANSFSATDVITDTGWHHVAVVGNGPLNAVTFYVDGTPSTGTGTITCLSVGTSTAELEIGNLGGGGVADFAGRIDEVTIYDRALSECEIETIFVAGEAGACKGDTDGDGVSDFEDNCPEIMNMGQTDTDGDRAGDSCDCATGDPGVISEPGDFRDVRLGDDGDKDNINWCLDELLVGADTEYDVVRGAVDELPVGSGAAETCLEDDLTEPETTDAATPMAGEAFYYIVRGTNSCGQGTYGFATDSTERVTTECP